MNRILILACLVLGCSSEPPATVTEVADTEGSDDANPSDETSIEPSDSAGEDSFGDTGSLDTASPDTGSSDTGASAETSPADTAIADTAVADTTTFDAAKADTAITDTASDGALTYTTEFPLCATLDMCSSYRADSGALILKSGESASGPRTPPFNPNKIVLALRMFNGSTTCTGQLNINIRSASTGYSVSGNTPVFAGGDTLYTMTLTRPSTAPLLVPPLTIKVTRSTTSTACATIPIQLRKSPVTFE